MAFYLKGSDVASKLSKVLKASAEAFFRDNGYCPCLSVVDFTEDIVQGNMLRKLIKKTCDNIGIAYNDCIMCYTGPSDIQRLEDNIMRLNADKYVHGIMFASPFPDACKNVAHSLINQISPAKDVDCVTDVNLGKLYTNSDPENNLQLLPTAAYATMYLASMYAVELESVNCVIVGDPNGKIVKPLTSMLLARGATVTVCHKKTLNLSEQTSQANVLFTAAEDDFNLTGDMVKDGSTVIDITGSIMSPDVKDIASCIAPINNGVGALIMTMLAQNTLTLARRQVER